MSRHQYSQVYQGHVVLAANVLDSERFAHLKKYSYNGSYACCFCGERLLPKAEVIRVKEKGKVRFNRIGASTVSRNEAQNSNSIENRRMDETT
ncbi:hypothetical protein CEXT_481391 [Caerostris extrusa]|uniref:Uncharacterized protein n=1 Tax=Caerostris extrusa TaxID=172846 RepID=A0AAV4R5N1_CAEEX|nr:hypothetical protein CEXT_481391 [Caerostris extrusa]